ncbi:MAG: hypothetical protein ABI579_00400 [Candidatus Sumerlaeota bacterium]
MAFYIASDRPLPLTKQPVYEKDCISSPTWPRDAQRFHTAALRQEQETVRSHFNCPHVLYAGSYEGCGCGFNYGREYPGEENDPEHRRAANESVSELLRYVRNFGVREIYICWFGDESKPTLRERSVTLQELASPEYVFEDRELLRIA